MEHPRRFRTKAKKHSLTYPKCAVPLDEMLRQLEKIAGHRYGWCLICGEDHEERENDSSVGVHRHVHQEYNPVYNFDTTNCRYWDITYEGKVYHPHFEEMKQRTNHIRYVMKDGNYLVEGLLNGAPVDLEALLQANQHHQAYGYFWVANELKKGKIIDEIDDVAQGFIVNNKRKIEEYEVFLQQKKERREVKPKFLGFQAVDVPVWNTVVDWTNKNFVVVGGSCVLPRRTYKQKQLWICSKKHDLGKSHPWKVTLRKYFRGYDWVTANNHKQRISVKDCDYILLDEFKGGATIHDLKELSQMMGVNIPIRYGQDFYFIKNVPLIVSSQYLPHELFSRPEDKHDVDSLASRFHVCYVDEECRLHPILPPSLPQVVDIVQPPQDLLALDLSFRVNNLVHRLPPQPLFPFSSQREIEIAEQVTAHEDGLFRLQDKLDEDMDESEESTDDLLEGKI